MIHFDGYTLQETATILDESLANTRNHYYRGMKVLRNFLHAVKRTSGTAVQCSSDNEVSISTYGYHRAGRKLAIGEES